MLWLKPIQPRTVVVYTQLDTVLLSTRAGEAELLGDQWLPDARLSFPWYEAITHVAGFARSARQRVFERLRTDRNEPRKRASPLR